MALDPFCFFRTLGLCKDPPVELTQPEWWVGLPGGGSPGLLESLRLTPRQQRQQLLAQQPYQQGVWGHPVDAVDVRESATEIYCMQAAASTYYLPAKQQQRQTTGIPQSHSSRAYAAAAPVASSYPASSRGSSDGQNQVPGFFGHLPLGKGLKKSSDGWGLANSTEPNLHPRGSTAISTPARKSLRGIAREYFFVQLHERQQNPPPSQNPNSDALSPPGVGCFPHSGNRCIFSGVRTPEKMQHGTIGETPGSKASDRRKLVHF
ncbi:uncharacterized protein LOC113146902 [Cyclospora cayetanensis]|uniref:Uncharacterized protein LOC113146902 n=1 Tax=Cyclospora cayetanensis TaxID=88456 RepID=A0A6P6RU97_9EIME|nr:uncharacterized protein LOC113146902 [Cyclospora cayetanensis]